MKKILFSLLMVVFVQSITAQQFSKLDSVSLNNTEIFISDEMASEKMVGLSVGIIVNGEVAHLKGYGVSDLVSGEAITKNSMFRLASVSKTITSVMALQLMEQNLLDHNP